MRKSLVYFLHSLLLFTAYTITIDYKIKPDDPGGPTWVDDKGINDTFIFELEEFQSGGKYLVIISIPGYLPISCNSTIQTIDSGNKKKNHNHIHHHQRGILDTSTNKIYAPFLIETQVRVIVKCVPIDKQLYEEMRLRKLGIKYKNKNDINLLSEAEVKERNKLDISNHIVSFSVKIESLWFFGFVPHSLRYLTIAAAIIAFIIIWWVGPLILSGIKLKHE